MENWEQVYFLPNIIKMLLKSYYLPFGPNLNQDNQNQTTIIPDPSHEDPFLCEHDNIVALEGQFSPDTKSLPLSDEKGTSDKITQNWSDF